MRQVESSRLCKVEEHDDGWIPDLGVMVGETEPACAAIHAEHRNVVAPLVAGIKELAGGVEIEAAWIASTRPFLPDESEFPGFTDRKYPNAVMQPVAGIDEPAIGRNQDLRAEVAAGEPGRQAGDGLPRRQPPLCGIVVEQDDVGTFLLEGVAPASVGVEAEVSRAIPRRQRNSGGIVARQNTAAFIELPNKNLIQSQIGVQNETSRGIGLNHVRVSSVVSAEGETPRRSMGGLLRSHRAGILLDVRGGPQAAVIQNWHHRHGTSKIIGDQHELPGWMDADIGGTRPAGTNGVEQGQLPVSTVNREGADRPFIALAHPVRLISGIQASAGGI